MDNLHTMWKDPENTRWNDGSQTQKATDCGAHICAQANPRMQEVDGWLMRAEQDRKMGEGDG